MSKALLILVLCLLPGFAAAQQPVEVTAAMEDLARRLAVPVTEIALASREQATWPDTSLGCPQPGSAYAQVLVPGYRLLLRVGGQEYEYHSDRMGQVVFCSRNIVNTTEIPAVVERARLDLARRLGCTPAEITVVETPFVEWPAPAFQRPEQLNEVPLRTTPGYRPILRCNGTEYAYQTDLLQEARFEQELPPGSNEAYRLAYLQVSQRPDGHNLWDLQVRNSITGQTTTPVRNLVDFALGPRHNQALIVRRASGNLHTLSPADRPAVALATAADFRGLCFNPTGDRYAVWARSTPADPWRLLVGPAGQSPTVYSFDQRDTGPGLPGPLHWQGDALAFSYQDEVQSRSFIIGLADGHVLPLPTGRFGAWLNQPGQYLLLDAGRLAVAHTDPATPAVVLATLPDLIWARSLTDPEGYLAMTQEGNMLRLWQGALQPGEPPRLVTELPGKLVQAQLSRRGTLLMVQQLADTPQRRGECRVTLVELPTATQEPLSGVCVRAQLLPVQ